VAKARAIKAAGWRDMATSVAAFCGFFYFPKIPRCWRLAYNEQVLMSQLAHSYRARRVIFMYSSSQRRSASAA
jgi:hypothetical protein